MFHSLDELGVQERLFDESVDQSLLQGCVDGWIVFVKIP